MIITLSVIRNLQVRINKTFCFNLFHTNICFLYANIFCYTQMHALLDENELNLSVNKRQIIRKRNKNFRGKYCKINF